jgi:glutamyl-tRNA synthetase
VASQALLSNFLSQPLQKSHKTKFKEDMANSSVRVRFAPSPTGPLHIGGVRTALYNYLFAKKEGGTFVLRIEDTDQTRYVASAEDYIMRSLKWCGFEPDESPEKGGDFGPYRQSERKEIYKKYADQLLDEGKAYIAFDSSDELAEMRKKLEEAKSSNRQYNFETRGEMRNSLTLSEEETKRLMDEGAEYVVRLKMPENEDIVFTDEIRGEVIVNSSNLDDKVLFKSDGMPTYHLANIVDDHLMKITHVIRGEEWLPSAPLHVMLYRAFGWEDTMPKFAHLPLILKPTGNGKLSKRDGDKGGFPVFPLEWKDPESGNISMGYKEEGYLPEAFVNMLALLGWNSGTEQELFSLDEMVQAFSMDRVHKGGAKFDPDKAQWFNENYLRELDDNKIAETLKPEAEKLDFNSDLNHLKGVSKLMKERVTFIPQMLKDGAYLFEKPTEYNAKTVKKKWKDQSPEIVNDLAEKFRALDSWTAENLENTFKSYLEEKGVGFGQAGPALRLVLTGEGGGPSLFEIIELIGREETLERMEKGVSDLAKA